jgi:SAM-dependent methyltransferase
MPNVKTSKAVMQSYADIWNQQVRLLWPETYPDSLSKAFTKLNVKSILDCAGGTGYPAIELKKMGWDISYSDGSETLVSYFQKRIEDNKLDIPAYQSRWETLTKEVPQTYDALMCSGNSFITINTYENDQPLTKASVTQNMRQAVREFYSMLKPNGVLYIDIFKESHGFPEKPWSIRTKSDTHRLYTTVSYDRRRNIRTTLTTITPLINNSTESPLKNLTQADDKELDAFLEEDIICKFFPIRTEELINLLKEAGFSRVEHAETDDAEYVNSFFAFKD